MPPVECIAFMLMKGDPVLAEQRKRTKLVMPGAIALPGGPIETGEHAEAALLGGAVTCLRLCPD